MFNRSTVSSNLIKFTNVSTNIIKFTYLNFYAFALDNNVCLF